MLEKGIAENRRSQLADPMKWGNDTGFAPLSPIDYSSDAAVLESLTARTKPALSIYDNYNAFDGFVMADEFNDLQNWVDNHQDPVVAAGILNSAFGKNVGITYDKLIKGGSSGAFPVAGQLMSEDPSFELVARAMFKGAEMRKEDPVTQDDIRKNRKTIEGDSIKTFSRLYQMNPAKQGVYTEAVKNLYASGMGTEDAISAITGGTVEWNGYEILSPVRGMTKGQYVNRLRGLPPAFWKQFPAQGYSAQRLRRGVLDGSLKQVGVSRGVSKLKNDNREIVKSPNGDPLLFKFNTDMLTSDETAALGRAADKKKRAAEAAAEKQAKAKAALDMLEKVGGPRNVGESI